MHILNTAETVLTVRYGLNGTQSKVRVIRYSQQDKGHMVLIAS